MGQLKPYQAKIIVLLTHQALLIAEIYRFFAHLFPETRDFWEGLSREEMDHASWMEYLYKKAGNGEVLFNDEKIRTYTLQSYASYLNDNLAKIKEKAPDRQGAFTLALSIENSLIVRRAFDHFRSTDAELAALLQGLREKLKDHRARIEAMFRELSGGIGTRESR